MHKVTLVTELSYDVHVICGLIDIEKLHYVPVLNLLHDLNL
jgi:hypothetical protein